MKALFVSNDPTIFDADSSARARMRAYAAAIGELSIVSPAKPGAKEETDGPLHLYPVRAWRFTRMRSLATRAHAVILERGIEVVSAQDPFEQGAAALQAIHKTNAKLHVQVHTDFLSPWFGRGGWREKFLNGFRLRFADDVLPEADGIRVVSERVKASLVARYGEKITEPSVIPVAVDTQVPPATPLPAHTFTFALIAAGRLEPEKRIPDILQALKLLERQYPMVGICLVGSGRERGHLEHLVKTLGLSKRVVFTDGWLSAEKAWGMMQSAQAFIQASAYEGYGRTLIEAALAGVPIITTDVGIVGDVLKDKEDVLAVPVADPAGLARAIANLVEDVALRRELPLHARDTARAHLLAQGDLPRHIADDLARLAV